MSENNHSEVYQEPAQVSYFFSKGYTDLKNTIIEAWQRNLINAKQCYQDAREIGIVSIMGAMKLIAALSIIVYGSIITAATTVLHVVVLGIFFALIYIGFGLLWLVDRAYIMIQQIRNICPHSDCQWKFLIPVYECPTCHRQHRNLVPSKYGILKRKCLCGTKLPTTFLNGRGELKAYCPECNRPLEGDTASRQYTFPVIGGPSVGKTCYINMAIHQLMEDVAPENGWDMQFMSEAEAKNHEIAMKSLDKGIRLMKTELDALTAYQLMVSLPNEKINRRIYIYDISGEMFSSSSDFQNNPAYKFSNGFIFIIDPLSLSQLELELTDKIDVNAYGTSSKDFEDVFNIMLINLEKMLGASEKDKIKSHLAIVINKSDIPSLDNKIGDAAIEEYLSVHDSEHLPYTVARDRVCKDFLLNYGAGNFVRAAESKFTDVKYFTCSALGHNHEGEKFEGKNVIEPIVWLLGQVDAKMKVKTE